MFLRFINPAIVSPYEAGILDKKPPPRIERGLKLMSKVKNYFDNLFLKFLFQLDFLFFIFIVLTLELIFKMACGSHLYALFLFLFVKLQRNSLD